MIWLVVWFGLGLALVSWWTESRYRRTRPMAGGRHDDIMLPHTEAFELYHNAFSLCSNKVRLCLEELQVAYRSHPINLVETGAYENIGRRFLAVNPAGLVPVLVHEGRPVYESHDILAYVAAHAPDRSLVPTESTARAEMDIWVDRASLKGDPLRDRSRPGNLVPALTIPMFAAMAEGIPIHQLIEGLLFHPMRIRPMFFLLLKGVGLRRLHWLAPAIARYREAVNGMHTALDELEIRLTRSEGPWMLGADFTLADVSWAVLLNRLDEADTLDAFLDGRPAIGAYWNAVQSRPSFATAVDAMRHPQAVAATARIRAEKANVAGLATALQVNGFG
ncbi:MAG: glutathione S-transferase family protein [Myxococcota bacterium]